LQTRVAKWKRKSRGGIETATEGKATAIQFCIQGLKRTTGTVDTQIEAARRSRNAQPPEVLVRKRLATSRLVVWRR
jgi:hypothetical protein